MWSPPQPLKEGRCSEQDHGVSREPWELLRVWREQVLGRGKGHAARLGGGGRQAGAAGGEA